MNVRKKIVIIGAGFGGLQCVKKLKRAPYDVTLLDKNNYFNFQPLMYQVAMGGLSPDAIAYPIRKITGPIDNATFRMCEVLRIDSTKNKVQTSIGDFDYDYLIIATGATTNFFGNISLQKNCLTLKSITDAIAIRNNVLQEFEAALATSDTKQIERNLNFVIVGGGPTGVELAGAIAEMKNHVLPMDYRELNKQMMHVHLVESGDEILSMFDNDLSQKALNDLQSLGVKVWLNVKLTNYDGNAATLSDGNIIETSTVIWAAGVKGNAVDGFDTTQYNRGNRLLTDRYNKLKGSENIFAIGDIACMDGDAKFVNGHPMVAPVATQQANVLCENLKRMAINKELKPFEYFDKGSMATIGRHKAIFQAFGIKLSGWTAWMAWMFLHLMVLESFRNKMLVFVNWVYNYLNYDRAIRLIIKPDAKNNESEIVFPK